jgi:murein DD-endopeptidase MepM/ murein hydrolase activator NlpD
MAHSSKRHKSIFQRLNKRIFGRLFCKRSIIIISEHKTQHMPFSGTTQMLAMFGALFVVGWASYSSGSFMAAQQVLVEKERKLATTTSENQRVEAEFTLLKRDLSRLAKEENKDGKLSDYAKMMSEQLAKEDRTQASNDDVSAKYNAVFKRIDYLENKVKALQSEHNEMIADIRSTTGGKIKELEAVIAQTGISSQPLLNKAQARLNQEEQRREKYGRIQAQASGGPFVPVQPNLLKEKETELYFDLKRMMTLREIVSALPVANPLAAAAYHETSTFGTRIDPFRGALAFHSGVDLAGPAGGPIRATSDGKVAFAGWGNAYGNMVDIDHDYGFTTRYGHLSKLLVQPGQQVHRGDVIALQGSTGRSTGNHLHYEVRYNDRPINPENFLKAGRDVRAFD